MIGLVGLSTGCVIFSSSDVDVQTDLDEHRALWEAIGVTDYAMRFQRICFCSSSLLIPVRLTIRGDTLVEVFDLETQQPIDSFEPGMFLTVDELFDFVQDAINVDAPRISVRYDAQLGHPTDIDVDLSRQRFDDDMRFEVRDFDPLN